ncbi:hypothetical protein C0995_012090 [Termitomyces sp. Mi166|nr:hypothetical protein C0995_012090 [Termitomyces sp. Mi166\
MSDLPTFPPIPPNIGAIAAPQWLVYETVQTALNGVDMYNWFAKGFGNISSFATPGLGAFYIAVMGSFMALIVQLFFCYRIWIINRAIWWWCLVIAAISGLQVVAGFIGGIQAHLLSDIAKRHTQTVIVYMWLVGDAVADVMIAVTMTLCLVRAMANVTQQTNAIVYRIIRLTVETNALSAGIAVLSIILFAGTPNNTYFITPFEDPMVTTMESHEVTNTNQTRTLGDVEIGLDSLHQMHGDKHNHL